MKTIKLSLIIVFCIFFLVSCNYGFYLSLFGEDDVDERNTSIKILSGSDISDVGSNSVYSFIVFSDIHFGSSQNFDETAFLSKFQTMLENPDETLKPRFAVCLGDCADGGHPEEYDQYNNFIAKMISLGNSKLGTSNYHVYSEIGNHDLYNNGSDSFRDKVFPHSTFYKFSVSAQNSNQGFTYLFLDSANGTFGDKQRDILTSEMKADSRPKIIFTHYPIYAGGNLLMIFQDTLERAYILDLFSKCNTKYVFEGHAHRNFGYSYDTFDEVVTSSIRFQNTFRLVTVDENTSNVTQSLYHF